MIRVLIADDQELVRAGIAAIVDAQDDMEVVGEAADGEEAVRLAETLVPDVVLMDIRMPNVNGIEATRRLRGCAAVRVVVLTTFDLDEYVYDALRAGASAFLLKDMPRRRLLDSIRLVAAGEALVAPSVTRRLIEAYVQRYSSPIPNGSLHALSPREIEVLRLVARGLPNDDIAAELFVSGATVKSHVSHILTKLGLRDRVQAVVAAYEAGLVRPGDPDESSTESRR